MSVTETRTDSGVIVVPDLVTRYRLAESQLALLPPADEDDAEEWAGLRFQCEEVMDLIERVSRTEAERDRMKAHFNAGQESERRDCEKALAALSGAGICTPEETYGVNTSWAISDLCRGVTALKLEMRNK